MNIHNGLKNIVIVGIFLTLLTPLIVANSLYFPFITGKAFFFRIIVEIIAACWIILALQDKKYRPQFSWITVALTVFTGVVLVADLFGMNVHKSMWSNFERMEGWVTIAHLWLYYIVASSMLQTTRAWERLINTSIGVSFILILHAFGQLLGAAQIHQGASRLDASLGNAAYFAVYLLVHIFLSLFMMYRKWNNVPFRWMYGTMAALQLFILYYTGTRGSILGLIGGVMLSALIVVIAKRNRPRVRNYALGTIIGVGVLIGGFQLIKGTEFVQSSELLRRLASISLSDAAPRLAIWNMALQGFQEKPILGWGQENFNYVFNKYYEPSMYAQEQWFDRAHNVFFDWLIAAGIVGLASYLSLFVFALWYIWKKKSEGFDFYERVIFTGLLTAYFIHNLFVFDHLVSYILFIIVLAYIHSFGKERPIAVLDGIRGKDAAFYATPLVGIALVFALYYVNIRPIHASLVLIDAITPRQTDGYGQNIEYFKKALAYNTVGKQEIREQLIAAAANVTRSDAKDEVKQAYFDLAKQEAEAWTTESPNDARAHLFAGTFFRNFGLVADAEKHFKKAVELSPQKQTMLFELATLYINSKRYSEALALLKKAHESEPNFEQARFMYALGAVYAGENELADALLAPLAGTSHMTDARLINAYASKNQYQKVAAIYEGVLEKDPKNSQIRTSLAATYLAMGNREAAIREIQRVIDENPSFKEEGEFYINEIRAGRNPAE